MTKRIQFIAPAIFKHINQLEQPLLNEKKIYIYSRNSVITSAFLNKHVFIHNGMNFIPVYIKPIMIGFKFGEFAYTRQRFIYKQSKKNKHGSKK